MAFPDRLLAQFAHFRFAAFRGEALTLQAMQFGVSPQHFRIAKK